jgi:hypothetical protein
MYLIQILLPTRDNDDVAFPAALFGEVKAELVEKFGGLTAFLQAPAQGLWVESNRRVARDDVAVFEVMSKIVERAWWANYRGLLQRRFRQDEIVVRSLAVDLL